MTLALLITAATGAWAEDTYTVQFKANGKTVTRDVTLPHTFELDPIIIELYPSLSGGSGSPAGTSASGNTNVTAYYNNSKHYATISASFEGAVTVTGQFYKDFTNNQYTLEINCMEKLVAISDDKTEATIKMPQYDVTATYTLKRDLSVETQVTVGDDHSAQPRYRVQKQGDTFQPVGMDQAQVMALFHVHDQIEDQDLAPVQDYTVEIYAVDIEGQPTGEAITFQNFTYAPGQYIVKAVGTGNYSGTTTQSNVFQLFQGYEVTVAPGDFATYYRTDDALYLEDTDAQLYTITAVSGQTATAEPISVAPAGTPVLVKNNSTDPEKTTILLIPTTTDQQPDAVTPYAGFRGTLEATTIAASDASTDRYALNGQQFVWVKNPVSIAANKAWLEVSTGDFAAGARAINIVFGEATGVSEVIEANGVTDDTFYDLNGRKVAVPNKKGIYIKNGKKVVVK